MQSNCDNKANLDKQHCLFGIPVITINETIVNAVYIKKEYKLFNFIPVFSSIERIIYGEDIDLSSDSLLSIYGYDETHIKCIFLGIKFKFPKKEYYKLKKQNPFYKYKAKGFEITQLPPAQGRIREIQLANLALLVELDYVCRKNNIPYWLDGGTLLGAVRHKGYIPWDDDIDVGMLMNDYEKVIDAFKKSSRDSDIYADYSRSERNPDVYFIKVQHKKCPHLFVDIFPFYIYGKSLDKTEQLKLTKYIKAVRKNMQSEISLTTSNNELMHLHKETMNNKILSKDMPEKLEDTDLVWGVQYNHSWNNWFTNYNVIFPLKNMRFEGYEFLGMNNPDAFLSRVYGDYMSYPKKITFGHSSYKKINQTELKIIKNLAQRVENTCQEIKH